jgi:malonyl-CoA O-methyltransferase
LSGCSTVPLESSAPLLDKRWARRSFDRASGTYDAAAVLQSEVRDSLLRRLELTDLKPRVVIDLGAGTGHAARALKRRYPAAEVIAIDWSLGMLHAAGRHQAWFRPVRRVCADAERLPLAEGSVDLLLSNFMLPWTDPDSVFAECRRILAPRGFLSFTTLGPDTLKELRTAWRESGAAEPRVLQFIDMHDIGDALIRSGFVAPVLDVERYTLEYTDVRHLAADLRAVGARNAAAGRPKGLTAPGTFAAMQAAYEQFRREDRLPATYEVVFGQAWAPAQRASGTRSTEISVAELKRQLQARRGA